MNQDRCGRESRLQLIKGFLLLVSLYEWARLFPLHATLHEAGEGLDDLRVLVDEPLIEIGKPKEDLDFLERS